MTEYYVIVSLIREAWELPKKKREAWEVVLAGKKCAKLSGTEHTAELGISCSLDIQPALLSLILAMLLSLSHTQWLMEMYHHEVLSISEMGKARKGTRLKFLYVETLEVHV